MKFMHEFRHAITILALGCILSTSIPVTAQAEYNPKLGRFVQRDPVETALLIQTALAKNAQTQWALARFSASGQYALGLNLFEYERGNPVTHLDPTGCRTLIGPDRQDRDPWRADRDARWLGRWPFE